MKIYIMQALIVCPCSDNLVYYIAVISKGPLLILQMLISTTECKEGMWTGRPDLGYWCNTEPTHAALTSNTQLCSCLNNLLHLFQAGMKKTKIKSKYIKMFQKGIG